MIDIHTHLLPGVDDGAADWETALNALEYSAAEGIDHLVCTPHLLDRFNADLEHRIQSRFDQLVERVKTEGISIQLYLGLEIHCFAIFDIQSTLMTLNGNGKYALIELPMGHIPPVFYEFCQQYLNQEIIPVLAHPERNAAIIQNPEIVKQLIHKGLLMQLNAGSLLGHFGPHVEKTAVRLMKQRLIHCVASDNHGSGFKTERLKHAFVWTQKKIGYGEAERLFITNPEALIHGCALETETPDEKAADAQPFAHLAKNFLFR